jgi:hypothetical protein
LPFPWAELPPLGSRPTVKTKETPMPEIKDPENTIIMTLKDGEVVIELLPTWPPNMPSG